VVTDIRWDGDHHEGDALAREVSQRSLGRSELSGSAEVDGVSSACRPSGWLSTSHGGRFASPVSDRGAAGNRQDDMGASPRRTGDAALPRRRPSWLFGSDQVRPPADDLDAQEVP